MDQLAKKMAKRLTGTFGANTEKNPKEECKAVITRSQKLTKCCKMQAKRKKRIMRGRRRLTRS